jgi:hypothetical protein
MPLNLKTKIQVLGCPWMPLNLKTKIQGLECPWICKGVLWKSLHFSCFSFWIFSEIVWQSKQTFCWIDFACSYLTKLFEIH